MRRSRIEAIGTSVNGRYLRKCGSVRRAVEAGRRCLARSHYHRADVRVLINTGTYRDGHVCEPANACYIQHGLGINIEFQGRRTLAFDLLNGGCGMLNGVHVITTQMRAGEVQVGMVVSSEANRDRRPDPAYTYPSSGAAVLLDVSPRRDVGFGAFAFQTNEEHAELFQSVVSLEEKRGRIVLTRASDLEHAYTAAVPGVLDEVLAAERLCRDEIDLVVPAQISPAFVGRLPRAMGIEAGRIVDYTASLPDTHSTSLFLALDRLLTEAPPKPGTKAVFLAFGSGITVGAAVYRF
ncbi:MAG TPA: 3-oxoacyl-[acyl-carrier-protein] synthase III C-terminal domain-containing protein [Vicinamibacterales bacterium]|jgi:3-oxoacyl-[acyl-carrier-protein] synthase-3